MTMPIPRSRKLIIVKQLAELADHRQRMLFDYGIRGLARHRG